MSPFPAPVAMKRAHADSTPSHWHRVAEWGYILNGTGRISAIDDSGRSYISDIKGPLNGTDPDIY